MDDKATLAEAIRALEAPGARRIRLKAEMRAIDAELRPLVAAALRAGAPIRTVARMTGLTTTTVMTWRS